MFEKQRTTKTSSNSEKKIFPIDTMETRVLHGMKAVSIEMKRVPTVCDDNRFITFVPEAAQDNCISAVSFTELTSASKAARSIEEQVKGSMSLAVINHWNCLRIVARSEEAYKELSTVLKGVNDVNVGMMNLDEKMKKIESELSEVKNEMKNMKDDIIKAIMDGWGGVSPADLQKEIEQSNARTTNIETRFSKIESASLQFATLLVKRE